MLKKHSNMAAKDRNTIRFDMSFSGKNTTYENLYLFDKGGFFTPGMTTRTDTITGWTGNLMSHDLAKYMIKRTKLIEKIITLTKEQKYMNDKKINTVFEQNISRTKIEQGYKNKGEKTSIEEMYLNRFEGISVATGNKLLWCHVDCGNFASPGFNVNLSINQCIHDSTVNDGNSNAFFSSNVYGCILKSSMLLCST